MRSQVIATKIDSVYDVELPVEIKTALNFFESMISFGMDIRVYPSECVGVGGHANVLRLAMIVPVALIGVIMLLSALYLLVKRTLTAERMISMTLPPTMTILFMAYPQVTNLAFESFSCQRL